MKVIIHLKMKMMSHLSLLRVQFVIVNMFSVTVVCSSSGCAHLGTAGLSLTMLLVSGSLRAQHACTGDKGLEDAHLEAQPVFELQLDDILHSFFITSWGMFVLAYLQGIDVRRSILQNNLPATSWRVTKCFFTQEVHSSQLCLGNEISKYLFNIVIVKNGL